MTAPNDSSPVESVRPELVEGRTGNFMRRALLILLVVVLAAPLLEACGKKPSELDPPPGEASDFPRKYPR
jgi:hypothetical protein